MLLRLAIVVILFSVSSLLAAAESRFLVGPHATWKYFAAPATPGSDWKQPVFNDAPWKSGQAGFGYGDGDDRTVLADMRGRYTSVYIRTAFELKDVGKIDTLYLYVDYDDGFIAYLNGTQVASASVRQTPGGLRVDLHEAGEFEEFALRGVGRLLRPGKNVLAIEGHNASINSSDLSLHPILSGQKIKTAVGKAEYFSDLDEFHRRLLDQSSYLTRRGFDYEAALQELRASVRDNLPISEFAFRLHKLVMQLGDCHANVACSSWPKAGRFLPMRPADTDRGVAALALDRNQPLVAECPYLESIDGVPLARWMEAAARYVACGSPQFVRQRSLQWLGRTDVVSQELGLPANQIVVLGLCSADGGKKCTRRMRLTGQGYSVARVGLRQTRMLDGNLGYLRLPKMDARLVPSTLEHIRRFRDTAGLVIDVRDNSGGTYHLLRAIFGYFVPEDAAPQVTNIAAYRLSGQFRPNHIEYRPTYRAEWSGWNDAEREAIRNAAATFRPEWQPPEGKFSPWHYMVLSRLRSKELDELGHHEPFYYSKPVVVLCNAASFSATDGFLNALAQLPQVTLVGESSGGGSGSTRPFTLPHTGITVHLSSMASFRADGKLFDGNGIAVKVAAKPTLEDFVQDSDSVLQRGISLLRATPR